MMLNMLHTQTLMPILTICAGLGDSEDALDRPGGMSRFGMGMVANLGGLTVDQARECARRTLHKVLGTPAQPRIKGAEAVEDWARRLADASQGWPQHLHSYFTAAWRTLVAQEHP